MVEQVAVVGAADAAEDHVLFVVVDVVRETEARRDLVRMRLRLLPVLM